MIIYGSPFRYYQGFGILSRLGELLAPLGNSFFIVGDAFVKNMLGDTVIKTLRDSGKKVIWDESFSGECTDGELKRLQQVYQCERCDAVLGIGGGKTMDTAKGISIPLRAPVGLVPTIAASDAPVSHVAIIYTDAHERLRVDAMPFSPWLVLVDTQIILEAPPRFLAAGIADALATKIEADACQLSGAKNYFNSKPPRIAQCIGDMCWDIMREHGLAALEAVKTKTHCQALEDVVEAATLLSGIGFESGGTAAAHGTMSALTALPGSVRYMHGELVAFGIVVQLCMEGRSSSFITDIVSFLKQLGLPTNLAGVGLDAHKDKADIEKFILKACSPPGLLFNMPMDITVDMYREAVYKADALGA
jgi:glycerol dehydrogenase